MLTSNSNGGSGSFTATESDGNGSSLQLYEKLSFSYPSGLLQPLIHERDTYLAWSLKRSKAVNKSKRVVGVIGRGHMNAIDSTVLPETATFVSPFSFVVQVNQYLNFEARVLQLREGKRILVSTTYYGLLWLWRSTF
ncbi:traB domain-containing protein isoform X2 [Cucumis melo var. makuwa]|uniref:TraB domain-containing protein isoform X2 n=1 Tax=Cucumis melo var. makuwa TaxID=1194695 RepID=A0A5D3D439_CUCMM|nr:traB domain-containing protein isoform X2 [Cucumis melo var. makuwa]